MGGSSIIFVRMFNEQVRGLLLNIILILIFHGQENLLFNMNEKFLIQGKLKEGEVTKMSIILT